MQIVKKKQKFQPVIQNGQIHVYFINMYVKIYPNEVVIIIITRNVFSYQNLNKLNGTNCKFDCFFFSLFFCCFFNNHLGFHLIIEIFLMLNNNDGNVQSYFKKKFIFHMFK